MTRLPRIEAYLEEMSESFSALPDKPEETAEGTIRALWLAAGGQPCSVELATEWELLELDQAGHERLSSLIEKRLRGIPLSHLTERQRFMGLEMLSGPEALIPRKETEILGRAALDILRELLEERKDAIVIDVCTGAGNLALAFAYHEPRCRVYGADLSEEATAFATKNSVHLDLGGRASFRSGDLLDPFMSEFAGRVDLLTCNPPYISSARVDEMAEEISGHEPHMAFDGGPFGIKILTKLLKGAPKLLKPGAWLCFEMGLGQGPAMAKRLESSKFYGEVRSFEDDQGEIRALAARTL